MARKNDSWGIEVGANAIKAVHLTSSGGAKGKVQMVGHEVLPFKKVLTTPDLNVDEQIQVKLTELLAAHDLSKSTVSISVPGHMAFARFAKLPPVPPKEVPKVVRYEAVQQIPFPIEEVEWDYQVFQQEDSPEVEVGIFAITKEKVMNYLTNYNAVNLQVDTLTLSPLAVYNAFVYDTADDPPEDGVIYMDIGTTSTDVIIVEDGGIWLRTLPLGGNTFTEALVKAFKLSFHKAEKLKREAATSKYARQIFQAMRPVFADLVQELQRSLGYYQSLNRDANLTKLVCVGSTFKLPGLQKFLKQQLQIEVVRPDAFERISPDDKHASEFADQAVNLATAYGLALQGLGLDTVSANVMPSYILRQRMWKAKQPWIGAAAACFVAMAGVAAGTAFKTAGEFEQGVRDARAAYTPVYTRANELKNRYNEIDTTSDPRQRIENLRGILDSRNLWPMLLEDVNLACMALDPNGSQSVLLGNDYDVIAQIPRNERKRIYIQSIASKYAPGGEAVTTGTANGATTDAYGGGFGNDGYAGGMGDDGYGGGYPDAGYGAGYGGGGYGAQTAEVGESFTYNDFFAVDKTPPSLTVTVKGITPNREGSKFLEENFLAWFKRPENADNPDRPYRYVADSIVLKDFGKVPVAPADTAGGAEAAGGYGAYGDAGGGGYGVTAPAAGGYGAGGYGAGGGYGDAGGYGAGGTASATDLAMLLPQRPLVEEDRSGDYQFVIQWKVELRNPNPKGEAKPESTDPDAPLDEPADDGLEPGQSAAIPTNDEDERGAS